MNQPRDWRHKNRRRCSSSVTRLKLEVRLDSGRGRCLFFFFTRDGRTNRARSDWRCSLSALDIHFDKEAFVETQGQTLHGVILATWGRDERFAICTRDRDEFPHCLFSIWRMPINNGGRKNNNILWWFLWGTWKDLSRVIPRKLWLAIERDANEKETGIKIG